MACLTKQVGNTTIHPPFNPDGKHTQLTAMSFKLALQLKGSFRCGKENWQLIQSVGDSSVINSDRVVKSPFAAFCSSESEKCGFHFPYKSMTYNVSH